MQTTTFSVHTGARHPRHHTPPRGGQSPRQAAAGGDGLLNVFVPHATAGVAILELGAASDYDLLAVLGRLLPASERWRHAHGTPGHGRSHGLPAFVPPSVTVPVLAGRLGLGTWQSITVVDLNVDNPDRDVRLSFVS